MCGDSGHAHGALRVVAGGVAEERVVMLGAFGQRIKGKKS
nr:MAG TPA: hypothetical protein [Caudoviricetes sp.]